MKEGRAAYKKYSRGETSPVTPEVTKTYTTKLPSGLEVITPEDTARQIADINKQIATESQRESLAYWRNRLETQTATIKRWREQLRTQGKGEELINRVIPEGSEIPKDMPDEIRRELLPKESIGGTRLGTYRRRNPNMTRVIKPELAIPKAEAKAEKVKPALPTIKPAEPLPYKEYAELKQSPRGRTQDLRRFHSVIIAPGDKRTKSWVKDPGRYDIQGIDTPITGRKPRLSGGRTRITPKTPRLQR